MIADSEGLFYPTLKCEQNLGLKCNYSKPKLLGSMEYVFIIYAVIIA